MAGGFSRKWTTMGSNSLSVIDSGTAGGGATGIGTLLTGVGNESNGGTNNQVRHQCEMWLVDGAQTFTPNMDWSIAGDFTVVLNATGQTGMTDPGAVEVMVEGSVDGENFMDMRDLGDWNAGTEDGGHLVYDFETYGRMPFMRLRLDGDAEDNSAKPFAICVFMHNA